MLSFNSIHCSSMVLQLYQTYLHLLNPAPPLKLLSSMVLLLLHVVVQLISWYYFVDQMMSWYYSSWLHDIIVIFCWSNDTVVSFLLIKRYHGIIFVEQMISWYYFCWSNDIMASILLIIWYHGIIFVDRMIPWSYFCWSNDTVLKKSVLIIWYHWSYCWSNDIIACWSFEIMEEIVDHMITSTLLIKW